MESRTLGILGGGQLGRMLALAARPLGIRVIIVDPTPGCPAAGCADEHVVGSFTDASVISRLAGSCDVVTIEIEHVSADALERVASTVVVEPRPSTIRLIQDKFLQKYRMREAGVPLGEFICVDSPSSVASAAEEWGGYPVMLKSRREAYDGRGNAVINCAADIDAAWTALHARDLGGLYVERWVHYVRELAVIVARSTTGEVVTYPTVQTIQRNNMCHLVIAPAPTAEAVLTRAGEVARAALSALEGAGVFAMELFELPDGQVLLNEVAPRVHNSGHLTIEGCHVSQFEQHIRAVFGMPLSGAELRVPAAAMINIIGDDGTNVAALTCSRALTTHGASLHWYGKKEARKGRKLGHVTVTGMSPMEVSDSIDKILGFHDDAVHVHRPLVGVIMGSDSDLPTMAAAARVLTEFEVPFELTIVSAHRTPQRLIEYATSARHRGLRVIIAAAGGAAHLPGMVAAQTSLPVIGVPVPLHQLDGMDSLLSIVQMPRGVPVATVAIGNATNGALLAIRILGASIPSLLDAVEAYQTRSSMEVLSKAADLDTRGWKAVLADRK